MAKTTKLLGGLAFPEAPRWHADRLWFTDQHAREVVTVLLDGSRETVTGMDDLPGGLGWLPDGTALVVAMTSRRVLRIGPEGLELHADLRDLASFHCNDMVVDAKGRAYVGDFGFDLHGGAPVKPAEIVRVDPDGRAVIAAADVIFPNGSVITPDGSTLIVGETFADRLTAFPLLPDGALGERRIWADLGEDGPDGICLDSEGAVWVASPKTGRVVRVAQGGRVLDVVQTASTPYACMLGGPDRRLLFIATSATDNPGRALAMRSGSIEVTEVSVPGAGIP